MSGGEKRRVSIGVDLIHDPAVLFLDEPTSGLDSTSALHVLQILSQMALTRHRTVVLTIHQPSYRLLASITKFLVLARGNVVYHGDVSGMVAHFSCVQQIMPPHVRDNTLNPNLPFILCTDTTTLIHHTPLNPYLINTDFTSIQSRQATPLIDSMPTKHT